MQKFYITAILFIAFTIQLSAYGQDSAPFEEATPSQQIGQTLTNDLPSESFRPSTRARPGDIGDEENAQKTPLGDLTHFGFLGLCGIVLSYGCYKQTLVKNEKYEKTIATGIFMSLLGAWCSCGASAEYLESDS